MKAIKKGGVWTTEPREDDKDQRPIQSFSLGGTPFLFRQGELVVIVKTQDHEFDLRPEQALTETGGFKVGEIESILHLKQDSISEITLARSNDRSLIYSVDMEFQRYMFKNRDKIIDSIIKNIEEMDKDNEKS